MDTDKHFSIKEIAELLGVTKQRVYRCIKANHVKETLTETVKGNVVLLYDNRALEQIKSIICNGTSTSHDTVNEAVNDTVNEALVKQLETKDNQIKDLLQQINDIQNKHHDEVMALKKIIDQEQQLHLINTQKILELEQQKEEPQAPKKWWKKIF